MSSTDDLTPDELAVMHALARLQSPAPPPDLVAAFRQRLTAEAVGVRHRPRARWPMALAAGVVLALGTGWAIEWRAHRRAVDALTLQLASALTDLSEARRFQVITTAGESRLRDPQVTAALTSAMLHDANTNVRVAAVEALAAIADPASLLDASSRAVAQETSPFVLAAIIAASRQMTGSARRQFLRTMLANPHLLPGLRAQAEAGIRS